MKVSFYIPAIPAPEPRKKARQRKTKDGKTFIQMYTPATDAVNDFKQTVKYAAMLHMKRSKPIEGPVKLQLVFVMPRTQNQIWKTKPMPRLWHWKKPDFDNLEKAICDALNGVVWVDDSQICSTSTVKVIAAGDEAPHVEFYCEALTEEVQNV